MASYMYEEDDRMLRRINNEWVNVSAKCKRQKNLGYYDVNDDDTYSTDQLDKYDYSYDMDDDIDDEDECFPRHHNDRRPDSFWMGDGFTKPLKPRYRPTPEPRKPREPHQMHQHGDDSDYGDRQKIDRTIGLLPARYPTFSAITLVGKAISKDDKPRSVRFLPQSPQMPPTKNSTLKGYHPYSRPGSASTPQPPQPTASLRSQIRDSPAIQSGVAKCCCFNSQPVKPMANRKIEVEPVGIQWRKPNQEQNGQHSSSFAATTTEVHQKSDGRVPKIGNLNQKNPPESHKIKIEKCKEK